MLTDSQIAAGTLRLSANGKLTQADQSDLLAAFRFWLARRANLYSGMDVALATAVSPISDRLAAALIELKAMGFSVTSLKGGKAVVFKSKPEQRDLIIRYAFGLLFDLPGEDTGIFGSVEVPTHAVW